MTSCELFNCIWEAIKQWDVEKGKSPEEADRTGIVSVSSDNIRLLVSDIESKMNNAVMVR